MDVLFLVSSVQPGHTISAHRNLKHMKQLHMAHPIYSYSIHSLVRPDMLCGDAGKREARCSFLHRPTLWYLTNLSKGETNIHQDTRSGGLFFPLWGHLIGMSRVSRVWGIHIGQTFLA